MSKYIPILSIDRAKCDFENIIGIVLEKNGQDLYKAGTKIGILKDLLARNQPCKIQPCNTQIFTLEKVKEDEIAVCANRIQSRFSGQGFVKCNCREKCSNNRCKCKKKKRFV